MLEDIVNEHNAVLELQQQYVHEVKLLVDQFERYVRLLEYVILDDLHFSIFMSAEKSFD
jgi:hypothetical protein